ncbi:gas vesicle protein [Candidatus Parcubacteria bacterium]|nr:gas vesicle protein [Candidatus Parcubacteria bacterium]
MSEDDQKKKGQITAAEVVKATLAFFETVLEKTARVVEVNKTSDDWTVVAEALEESDYMRRFGRGDMLGIYEVTVDSNLSVVSYIRKELRERSALG